MISTGDSLAVLIATKNRKYELTCLLNSISISSVLPSRVIIVYAGQQLDDILIDFSNRIKIDLIFSEIASQAYQKKLGISKLMQNEKWVLFLDDDVVLEKDTIKSLLDQYLGADHMSTYAGFGLAIRNQEIQKYNQLTQSVLAFAKLYSPVPGIILSSGHPQTYLQETVGCEVNWLNGISAWRSDVLSSYGVHDLRTDYSAYEDIIFSYSLSKVFKLFFSADVAVLSQYPIKRKELTSKQFISASYIRYFFVDNNKELSKFSLIFSHFFRSIDFVFRRQNNSKMRFRIWLALKIWFDLIRASIFMVNSKKLINKRLC
jgi:GT2 family glycosyltransferase